MAPGSVIVDLAGESGGNCELTEAGRDRRHRERRQGDRAGNLPTDMAANASQLYAKNIENLLGLLVDEEGKLSSTSRTRSSPGACITHERRDPATSARPRAARGRPSDCSSMDLMTEITIFVLAAFVGFEVISKVPTTLHTPLMSQTNAIHGIVMLGGLIVVGLRRRRARED